MFNSKKILDKAVFIQTDGEDRIKQMVKDLNDSTGYIKNMGSNWIGHLMHYKKIPHEPIYCTSFIIKINEVALGELEITFNAVLLHKYEVYEAIADFYKLHCVFMSEEEISIKDYYLEKYCVNI